MFFFPLHFLPPLSRFQPLLLLCLLPPIFLSHLFSFLIFFFLPFFPPEQKNSITGASSTARGSRRSTAETRRGKKKRRKKKEKNEPFSFRPAFPIPAFFFVYKRSVNKKETHIVKDRERTATGEAAKRQGGGRRKREEAKAPLHLFFSLFLFGLLSSLVERSKNSSCDKEGTDPGKGCCVSLRRGKRERASEVEVDEEEKKEKKKKALAWNPAGSKRSLITSSDFLFLFFLASFTRRDCSPFSPHSNSREKPHACLRRDRERPWTLSSTPLFFGGLSRKKKLERGRSHHREREGKSLDVFVAQQQL